MVTALNCLNLIRQNMLDNQFHYPRWSKGKEFQFYLAIQTMNKSRIEKENLKNVDFYCVDLEQI